MAAAASAPILSGAHNRQVSASLSRGSSSHTNVCKKDDLLDLLEISTQAKPCSPRGIREIFRAEEGWRPAPSELVTTWEFGAIGQRLIPVIAPDAPDSDTLARS